MNNYFLQKEQNMAKALSHTEEMHKKYRPQISLSKEHSQIYGGDGLCNFKKHDKKHQTEISLMSLDTVSALAHICEEKDINIISSDGCLFERTGIENIGVLNFASYKHPGGMFLKGSMAQEEALCHESYLYNVLRELPKYYEYNNKRLKNALYTDRALFTPDIIFRDKYECGVLTCAAPNYTAAHKYRGVEKTENYKVLKDRVRFMFNCFAHSGCNIIILGAWGCGVFGQDPEEVASLFKEFLNGEFKGVFKKVIITVPMDNTNYPAFKKVF